MIQIASLLAVRSLTDDFAAHDEIGTDLFHVGLCLLEQVDSTVDARVGPAAVTELGTTNQLQIVVVARSRT